MILMKPFLVKFKGRECISVTEYKTDEEATAEFERILAEDSPEYAALIIHSQSLETVYKYNPYYRVGATLPEDLDDGFSGDAD